MSYTIRFAPPKLEEIVPEESRTS